MGRQYVAVGPKAKAVTADDASPARFAAGTGNRDRVLRLIVGSRWIERSGTMSPFDHSMAIVLFAFSVFLVVASIQELFEPKSSPKYRNLSGPEIVLVKAESSMIGLGLAAFCAVAGVQFPRQTRKRPS